MSKSRAYSMTTPCDNCPFRSDITFHLRPERVREIEEALDRGTFSCHKTTMATGGEFNEEDGEYQESGKEIHCAGSLILLEKEGRSSQMMRIAERLGMYDARKLDMEAPVFDTFDDMYERMVELEEGGRRKRKRRKTK